MSKDISRLFFTGAYNVDSVLAVMVKGLEEELRERLAGGRQYVANESPSGPSDEYDFTQGDLNEEQIKNQGASLRDIVKTANKAVKFIRRKNKL